MKIDIVKEYKDLAVFLMRTLQDSMQGDQGAFEVLSSLHDSLRNAAEADQVKRVHKQVKGLLLKEKPLDGHLLLRKIDHLKQELLSQSSAENDLRQLVDECKKLVEMALRRIESLSLADAENGELFRQCRRELADVKTVEAMRSYAAKFKQLFSVNLLLGEETDRERDELKKIISILADSISSLLSSSGEFDSGLDDCIKRLKEAHSLREVQEIRELLLRQTEGLQTRTRRMLEDVKQARDQVDSANRKIEVLKSQMEKVKQEIIIDPLTRAYNRRAFDEKLKHEITSMRRYEQSSSMVIIDIDHFKQVNDTYGHRTGDGVLRVLSGVMRKEIREVDVLARYGGEEFALLLPHTVIDSAFEVAERIRRKVADSRFTYKGKPFVVTISAGVGSLRADDDAGSYIERVDKALYEAKRQGRNRVVTETAGA